MYKCSMVFHGFPRFSMVFPFQRWKSLNSLHVARKGPVVLHPQHVGHATAQGHRFGAVDQAPIAAEFHLPGVLALGAKRGMGYWDVNHGFTLW